MAEGRQFAGVPRESIRNLTILSLSCSLDGVVLLYILTMLLNMLHYVTSTVLCYYVTLQMSITA